MDENYNNNSGDDSSNSFDSLNSDYSYNSYDSADTGSDISRETAIRRIFYRQYQEIMTIYLHIIMDMTV